MSTGSVSGGPRLPDDVAQAIFHGAPDVMVVAGDDRRYLYVNDAACDLFGANRSELLRTRI